MIITSEYTRKIRKFNYVSRFSKFMVCCSRRKNSEINIRNRNCNKLMSSIHYYNHKTNQITRFMWRSIKLVEQTVETKKQLLRDEILRGISLVYVNAYVKGNYSIYCPSNQSANEVQRQCNINSLKGYFV